jgi:hypothetical protein
MLPDGISGRGPSCPRPPPPRPSLSPCPRRQELRPGDQACMCCETSGSGRLGSLEAEGEQVTVASRAFSLSRSIIVILMDHIRIVHDFKFVVLCVQGPRHGGSAWRPQGGSGRTQDQDLPHLRATVWADLVRYSRQAGELQCWAAMQGEEC